MSISIIPTRKLKYVGVFLATRGIRGRIGVKLARAVEVRHLYVVER